MSFNNDGGQAFPGGATTTDRPGMSLRDQIALRAMQSYLISGVSLSFDSTAINSYEMADAMLSARRMRRT